jgi:hypothetical protein
MHRCATDNDNVKYLFYFVEIAIFALYLFDNLLFMKNGRYNRFVAILLHPALLALPVAVFVILLLPDVFDKYTVEPVYEKILREGLTIGYHDLDHDGSSEWYYATENNIGGSAISIHNYSGVLHHWDFDGLFIPDQPKCIVGDYDNNGKDEIYAFTLKGDSLIVNGIDYRMKEKTYPTNRFIAVIKSFDGKANFSLTLISLSDLTGDGFKEIIFATSAGYGLKPRKVFALDVKNDTLFFSPELGGHIGNFDVADIDRDGLAEIAVSNYGPGNIKDKTLPMQDSCSYVIVLDNDLEFLFPPISSPGRFSGIGNQFLCSGDRYYIVSYWGFNTQSPGLPAIKIYDISGKLIRERSFPFEARTKFKSLSIIAGKNGNEYPILSPHYDQFELFDLQLNPIKKLKLKNGSRKLEFFDFDQDGEKEIYFEMAKPGEWCILRSSLKHSVVFKTHFSEREPSIYPILRRDNNPQFCIQLDNHQYIFEYAFNSAFHWQYPVYLVIYLSVLLFILMIRNLQRIQLRKKYETDKKMAELQLLSLRNQMDPHFTFNVLNTIGSVILQNKGDESYDLLMKFSKMIRTTINSANRIVRPLEEELNFVRNYLELQQFRHAGYFTYLIEVDPGINTQQPVPKMILQTYVENALKHGLVPRKGGGELLISVKKVNTSLELSVQDNGIGRQQAKINGSTSTGVGLSIINQYYQLLNRDNTNPITEKFIDLFDEQGNAAGTRVVVCIPEGFVFPGSPVEN